MLKEAEIVETLIELYASGDDKRKGAYKLSKDEFKAVAGRKNFDSRLLTNLDITLAGRGYRLLDYADTEGYVFMVGGRSLAKQLQSLPDELIEEYTVDDEDW
ncbi:hypothetical protein [Modicisalibacter sp. 'Wilcox']|uniref:hypothetical protein n=1 Tax=Modicisalibacter sp. 'Wilcox' TaxID=2679914 RepID=UPI0013D5DECE|nr:hypothetical protein [Modicisalibacter sp. 'Wilcox']